MERESMEFDVVIVGAGPAGLSAAIRLAQLSHDQNQTLSVCVIEKGSEVGAHILSGALFETRALDELLPDWREMNAPIANPVSDDEFIYLTTNLNHLKVPSAMVPCTLKNSSDNHAISLGKVCRWLAQQAEQLGVEIFPALPRVKCCMTLSSALSGYKPRIWDSINKERKSYIRARYQFISQVHCVC